MQAQTGKYRQLLDYLAFRSSPVSWREIVGRHVVNADDKMSIRNYYFPKKTLARLLEKGDKEGLIKKTKEPILRGQNGRPGHLYELASGVSKVYPAIHLKGIGTSKITPRDIYFFGSEKKCKSEKTSVTLFSRDKKIRDHLCLTNPLFAADFAEAVMKDRNKRRSPNRLKKKRRPKISARFP